MIGAIIGDIAGSIYELGNSPKTKDISIWDKDLYYTDDSICTIAVCETILNNYPLKYDEESINKLKKDLVKNFIKYVNKYPYVGYGNMFYNWATKLFGLVPYNSFGNGSAMRISPVGWIASSVDEVKILSKAISEVTHNHVEAIKAAEATAMCIYLARVGKDKEYIKEYIKTNYYDFIDELSYKDLINNYKFDVSAKGTVPIAIYCFLISSSFEDCLKTTISVGGDSDTLCAISASIAEAFYKEDYSKYYNKLKKYLDDDLLCVIDEFNKVI